MISSFAAYLLLVSILLACGGWWTEHTFLVRRWPRRFLWLATLSASVLFPVAMALSVRPATPAPVLPPYQVDFVPSRATQPVQAPLPVQTEVALAARPATAARSPIRLSRDQLIAILWVSSSIGTAAWYLLAAIRLARLAARAPSTAVEGVTVRRTLAVGPAVFGVFRPVILWPRWLEEAPAGTRAAAIAHERQHLAAGDPLLLATGLFLVLLAPWNPALWWQLQRMRFAIEADCDRRVVDRGTDEQAYALALLQIAQARAADGAGLAVLMSTPSWLERRVRTLLHSPGRRMVLVAAVGAPLALAALTAVALLPASSLRATEPARGTLVSVITATAVRGDMAIRLPALGTITPLATVTVKPLLSGQLTRLAFTEGQMVHKGDLLAQIDARTYQAVFDLARVTLKRDQALLEGARQEGGQKAIVAQSAVEVDEAALAAAKVNLENTRIVSPVTGVVGLRQVDEGNYVTPADANGIVVVTQQQPITAVFSLPEDNLLPISRRMTAGGTLPVTAWDRSHQTKLGEGKLLALDNQIDTTTGTAKLRAIFDNKDGALFPNQFVNIELVVDTLHDQVVMPTAAAHRGAAPNGVFGTFVYVVNTKTSTVSVRSVTLGTIDGDRVAVTAGLVAGDVVVTEGGDRLRDGAQVLLRESSPARKK
jgi:multidrug efflux system membrane fusion protein